jgi:hypothetical protein
MMSAKQLVKNVPLLITVTFVAAIITTLAAMRLRFADAFKPFFVQTCISMPEEEFVPTLVVFLVCVAIAVACSVNALVLSTQLRRFVVGLMVAFAAFAIAFLAHRAI